MESSRFETHRRSAYGRGAFRPRAIVAIPVRNEEDYLEPCLRALGAQRTSDGQPLGPGDVLVLLLLNGCTDNSWTRVQALRDEGIPSWIALDGELVATCRHAGGARTVALSKALSLATSETCLIACTDADTVVGPTWIARQCALLEAGTDAVMGIADILPVDEYALPQSLRLRQRLERSYGLWLDRIDALLDPQAHDPWPRHTLVSGASLGFRPAALRMMRPLPAPRCGEDRALIERCHMLDLKVHGDMELSVITSGRLQGRADGGMASTLTHRMHHPHAPCDERLEPFDDAVARATWRSHWRSLHRHGRLDAARIAQDLSIDVAAASDLTALPTFGLIWHEAECIAPALARRRLRPDQLPQELRRASAWYDQFLDAHPARRTLQSETIPLQPQEVTA